MRLSIRIGVSKLLKLGNRFPSLKEYRPRLLELLGLGLIVSGVFTILGLGPALLVAGVALVGMGYVLSD